MSAESVARLAEALAALIWPLIALMLAVALLPVLREIVRQRQFTIRVGSFELSAQQATNQLVRQIEDLQGKMAGMEAEGRPAVAHEGRTEAGPRSLTILWIDDRPENNAVEIATLESEGHRVLVARSSEEAARIWQRQRVDVILSDVARSGGGREGIELLHDMRQSGDTRPVGFYTSAHSMARHADAMSGAFVATTSFVELMAALRELAASSVDADQLHP